MTGRAEVASSRATLAGDGNLCGDDGKVRAVSTRDITEIWDQPGFGLTQTAFARWPSKQPLRRDDYREFLQSALDQQAMMVPVYLLGKARTYKSPDGEPRIGANIVADVLFVVNGSKGSTPFVTVIRRRGLFNKRIEAGPLGAGSGNGYDDYWVEDHAIGDVGDIDLQFVDRNLPTFKLSFGYRKDQRSKVVAQEQARAVMEAVDRCRSGQLPVD